MGSQEYFPSVFTYQNQSAIPLYRMLVLLQPLIHYMHHFMDDFGRLWNMKSVIPLMYEKSAPQIR